MKICLTFAFVFFNLSTIVSIQIFQGFAGQSLEIKDRPEWFISGCDLKRDLNAAADDRTLKMNQNTKPVSGISEAYNVMNQRILQCYYEFPKLQLSCKSSSNFYFYCLCKGAFQIEENAKKAECTHEQN